MSIALFFFCTSRIVLVSSLPTFEQWQELKKTFRPPSSFQGQGTIQVKSKDYKIYSVAFSSLALGDSLLRLDVFHPLGGILLRLHLTDSEYCLTIPSQNKTQQGKYSDSLFQPFLGINVPLDVVKCVFTARPFIPGEFCDSITHLKNEFYFYNRGAAKGWEIKIKNQKLEPVELVAKEKQNQIYRILWSRYKNNNARRIEIKTSEQAILCIDFKKIQHKPILNTDLFKPN